MAIMDKNRPLIRLIITVAIIIVAVWLIGFVFKAIAWLLNGLVGVAALVLIVALVYSFIHKPSSATPRASKKPPLKLEREPSKEKRD